MKVGLLHSRTGVAGLWGPALEASALVGAAEINANGGICGEPLELVLGDCGFLLAEALSAVDDLIEIEGVDAMIGGHASNVRDAVSARVARRVPYIYTAQYEGSACGPSTVAIGSVDYNLLAPSLAWMKTQKNAERFFFVGNDYVWPRMAVAATKHILRREGLRLVGETLLPVTADDFGPLLTAIARSRAQVVVMALLGQSAVEFNRAFAAAGLDRKVLRFGLIIDESVICNIGPEASDNLFTAAEYFGVQRGRFNDHFRELYHDAFGAYAPPISAASIGYYEALHALSGLVRNTGVGPSRWLASEMERAGGPFLQALKPGGARPGVYLGVADGVTLQVVTQLTH